MKETFATPAVSAIIQRTVNGERCILLQRRQKEDGGETNGLIEVVGGKIRAYENIFDALRREVWEETGLTVTEISGERQCQRVVVNGAEVVSFSPFCTVQNLSGVYSLMMHTFLCRAEGEPLESTNETTDLRWASVEEVARLLEEQPEGVFPLDILPLRRYVKGALG